MRVKKIFIFYIIIISGVLFHSSCIKRNLDPLQSFKYFIVDPIPKSVKNIKVDQSYDFGGYVFRFNISEKDINIIVNSIALKRVSYLGYENGRLSITYEQHISEALVYQPEHGINEPVWFTPQKWSKCDAYALCGDDFNKILLYNKDKGEAYFCRCYW